MMGRSGAKSVKGMEFGDRISGLPDKLLHHGMSFLPARDAVRTCVLSPRWRYIWVSARRLNIDTKGFTTQRTFKKFVTVLLLSCGYTPLDSFYLDANGPGVYLENFCDTAYLWIRHALRSNVRTLCITDHNRTDAFKEYKDFEADPPNAFLIDHCPFTSSYLKRLHLCGVSILECFLTELFFGCPALENLDIKNCVIRDTDFSSATLKNLSIDFDRFPFGDMHDYIDIVINMPSLVSLHIGALPDLPSLVNVQSLRTTSICLDDQEATFADGCNILGALSNVKNLELLFLYGVTGVYSLKSDMHLCQVSFTNLTTLSISDWCLHDNCEALLYMLEHSPNLEELTLKIREKEHGCSDDAVDTTCQKTTGTAFNCEKLKKVEIICPSGDRRVGMLVTILLAKIISAAEIRIKQGSGVTIFRRNGRFGGRAWKTCLCSDFFWTMMGSRDCDLCSATTVMRPIVLWLSSEIVFLLVALALWLPFIKWCWHV